MHARTHILTYIHTHTRKHTHTIYPTCTNTLHTHMYTHTHYTHPYENIECNLYVVYDCMHAALLKWLQNECRTVPQCCTHGTHKQFERNKAAGCFALTCKLHACSMKAFPCCWFAFIMHVCSLLSYNNIVIVLFAGDLHACGLYSYDSSSLFGFLWLANYTRVVCGFLHTVCVYACNLTLPIQ